MSVYYEQAYQSQPAGFSQPRGCVSPADHQYAQAYAEAYAAAYVEALRQRDNRCNQYGLNYRTFQQAVDIFGRECQRIYRYFEQPDFDYSFINDRGEVELIVNASSIGQGVYSVGSINFQNQQFSMAY